jgi:hypothetical protein
MDMNRHILHIGIELPFTILNVESNLPTLLGYFPHHLRSKSLKMLQGPKTEIELLHNSIKRAIDSDAVSRFQVLLYESSGCCRNIQVSCSRIDREVFSVDMSGLGFETCCSLSLETPAAIVLDEVYQDSSCAWALISAEWPHCIQMVNEKFTGKFGYTAVEAAGLTLFELKPNSSDPAVWHSLLWSACEGQRVQESTTCRTKYGQERLELLSFVPVMAVPNGAIEHIMLQVVGAPDEESNTPTALGRSLFAEADPSPSAAGFSWPHYACCSPPAIDLPPASIPRFPSAPLSSQQHQHGAAAASARSNTCPASRPHSAHPAAAGIFLHDAPWAARPAAPGTAQERFPPAMPLLPSRAHEGTPPSAAPAGTSLLALLALGGGPGAFAGFPGGGGAGGGSWWGGGGGVGAPPQRVDEEYVRRLRRRHDATERRARRRASLGEAVALPPPAAAALSHHSRSLPASMFPSAAVAAAGSPDGGAETPGGRAELWARSRSFSAAATGGGEVGSWAEVLLCGGGSGGDDGRGRRVQVARGVGGSESLDTCDDGCGQRNVLGGGGRVGVRPSAAQMRSPPAESSAASAAAGVAAAAAAAAASSMD